MDDRDRIMRQGRRRLRALLPVVRARFRAGDYTLHDQPSALFGSMAGHIRESNLDALIVYPAPKGGWHCDLLLKKTPPGVPNVFGSPVAEPYPTERDAEDRAPHLLAAALTVPVAVATDALLPGKPVFMMNDAVLDLMPEILGKLAGIGPGGYGSKDVAQARLRAVMAEVFPGRNPGECDHAALELLDEEARAKLWFVLHMAALSGVWAWPLRLDQAPSDAAQPAGGKDRTHAG